MHGNLLVCLSLIAVTQFSGNCYAANGQAIDLSQYHETFLETFRDKLDVTPWGPSHWIAHTPWHGDFGDAQFSDPEPGFPFLTGSDGLQIIARKGVNGKWRAGLLSSVDSKGQGFAQSNGYFEARMKMPPGPGVWPAFWLTSSVGTENSAEIDVVEFYGVDPTNYHVNLHLWPKAKEKKPTGQGAVVHRSDELLSDRFHTYGVEITNDDVVFYFDRHEVSRMPAASEMHNPMSLLVNLALGSGWPIDQTPDPSILHVDYIKVFQKNGTG